MSRPRKAPAPARSLAIVLTALLVSGCAATITAESLVPKNLAPSAIRHPQSVSIAVSGGKTSDPTGLPTISNQAFTDALTSALKESGVFGSVTGYGGDYQLSVLIVHLQQPLMGGAFTVSLETGWRLQEKATGRTVWEKGVTSSHTVSMGEEFFGPTRVARATEGAARENIRRGVELLSQLQF